MSLDVARRRLRAELRVLGVRGFEGVELMTRTPIELRGIVDQSEAAIIEIAGTLDKLGPQPLLTTWYRQRRTSS